MVFPNSFRYSVKVVENIQQIFIFSSKINTCCGNVSLT